MIDKISKLLAKAERTDNPQEAEVFTAKAMELMMKWSIDEAMLASHRKDSGKVDEIIQINIPVRGVYYAAHTILAHQVGTGFGFRTIRLPRGYDDDKSVKERVAWVGFESDIATAQLLYTSILIQLEKALKAFVKERGDQFSRLTASEKYITRRSFIYGFSDTIGTRIMEMRTKTTEATEGAALVLYDRSSLIDAWVAERYSLRKARSSSHRISSGGYGGGVKAGERANLATKSVPGSRKALGR